MPYSAPFPVNDYFITQGLGVVSCHTGNSLVCCLTHIPSFPPFDDDSSENSAPPHYNLHSLSFPPHNIDNHMDLGQGLRALSPSKIPKIP